MNRNKEIRKKIKTSCFSKNIKFSQYLCQLILLCSLFYNPSAFAQNCTLSDNRICVLSAQLQEQYKGKGIIFKEWTTSSPNLAAEYEWVIGGMDFIHLGNTQDYTYDELTFLIAHEYAHSIKNHARKGLENVANLDDKKMSDIELFKKYKEKLNDNEEDFNHQQEFEADEFAINFMIKNKLNVIEAMKEVLKNNSVSSSHPSRKKRLEKAKNILNV